MLLRQPLHSDTYEEMYYAQRSRNNNSSVISSQPLTSQKPVAKSTPHGNLFEIPEFHRHQFKLPPHTTKTQPASMQSKPSVKMMPTSSLLDPYLSTMDHKPLHQDQLSSTYSSPQLEAGKFLARVFKESKILAAAKKPAKVPTKIKHQLSSKQRSKKESKLSNIVTIDHLDDNLASTYLANQRAGLLLSSSMASNSSLQVVAQVEQFMLTHLVHRTTGPVLSSNMTTSSAGQTTALFQKHQKVCLPQEGHPVYMYSREGKRRPESQICGDEEDPEMTQLQKWRALDDVDEDDIDV